MRAEDTPYGSRLHPAAHTPIDNGGITGGRMPQMPTSGTPSMSSYFSDPVLQSHLNFGQSAMSKLMQPQTINPILQQAIAALSKASSAGPAHLNTDFYDTFKGTVQKRQGELNQPGYSQSQQDILRTNVTDPMTAQRDAARQQLVEHFAAKGFTPESGVVQQALIDSDRQFSQMRTAGERDLATKEMAQDEARKNQAVDIGSVLAQLGLSGSTAQLGADTASRGQNLQAAGGLAGIGSDLQQEPIQRLMSAFGISQNMSQMPYQALNAAQSATNTVNSQHVPEADNTAQMIQLLLALSGQGNDQYQNALTNGSNFWGSMGESMPALIAAFSQMYGKKTPQAGLPPSGYPSAPPQSGGSGSGRPPLEPRY